MSGKKLMSFKDLSHSHLNLTRLLGFLPFEGRDLQFIGTQILSAHYHLMSLLNNSTSFSYGVRMIIEKRFEIDYICEFMVIQSIHLRYILISLNRKKLIQLMNMCENLWSFVAPEDVIVVKVFERKAFFFRTFLVIYSIITLAMYMINWYFVQPLLLSDEGVEYRMMAFKFCMEFYNQRLVEFLSLIQLYISLNAAIIFIGIDILLFFIIMMTCGYLRTLQQKLQHVEYMQNKVIYEDAKTTEAEINNNIFKSVLLCALFYQKILEFAEELEIYTRKIYFVTIFVSLFNISTLGLKILQNDNDIFVYIALLGVNLITFLLSQLGPEYLLVESKAIRNCAYSAVVIQSEKAKINKILLFIMVRAREPIQLTAGGYIKLSMENFGNMIRSAISFFTILRNLKF